MKTKTILKYLLCNLLFVVLKTNAQIPIYSNGRLSTGAFSKSGVAAPAGYTWSECQNNTGNTSVTNSPVYYTSESYPGGSNFQASYKYLSEDFIVPAGQNWNIDAIEFFYYDINATASNNGSAMDRNRVLFYTQDPATFDLNNFPPPFAEATIDAVHNAVDAGMHHIPNTGAPFNGQAIATPQNKIWKEKISVTTTNFPPGRYYMFIAFDGEPIKKRAFPMVKKLGFRGSLGWNAKYLNQFPPSNTVWENIVDGGQPTTNPTVRQDLPFNIYGSANGLLPNDACSSAKLINEFPYNYDEDRGYLATNNNGFINASCANAGGMNDGEWFRVQGTGANIVVAVENVNLAYDPQVTVYTGSCGFLTCVSSADNNGDGGDEFLNIPNSNQDITYYINVGNYSSNFDNSEYNFSLFVNSTPTVPNDACINATLVTSLPYSFAETQGALATNNSGFLSACPNKMNDGEWFKVIGTGNIIEVKINFQTSNYDSQIGVFKGSCGVFTCVDTVDGQSAGNQEVLTFPSEINEIYYINIGNYSDVTDLPEGDFSIFIKQYLANDECATAKNISTFPYEFYEIYGNLATNNTGFVTGCSGGLNDGEWFKFTGSGRNVVIDLTNVQSNYDPELAVYSGDCGTFNCEGYTDVGISGQNEKLTIFNTIIGTTYYVNIGQYSANTNNPEGNFKITLKEVLLNDDCLNATFVPALPYTYLENYGTLTTNNVGFRTECAVGMNDGEWFKVFGNGGEIRIDLTQVATNYDVEIAVYSGTCFNLTCVTNRDTQSVGGGESLLFDSVLGQTYFINVGQYYDNIDNPEGNFKIDITTIVLSNKAFEIVNLKTYPNPIENVLTIENTKNINQVIITNMLGQEVLNKKFEATKVEIDFSGLKSGYYFAQVYSEGKEQIIKLIKN